MQNFVGANLKERYCKRDLRLDGKINTNVDAEVMGFLSPELDCTGSGYV